MFWWPRPQSRMLSFGIILQNGEYAEVIEKESVVSRYKLTLVTTFTKGGQPHSGSNAYWAGLDDGALTAMLGLGSAAEAEVKKAANQGGDIRAVLSHEIEALDGGALPAGANGPPVTYNGITRHGKSDIDDAILSLGKKLSKWGRENAEKKEGKRKHN